MNDEGFKLSMYNSLYINKINQRSYSVISKLMVFKILKNSSDFQNNIFNIVNFFSQGEKIVIYNSNQQDFFLTLSINLVVLFYYFILNRIF